MSGKKLAILVVVSALLTTVAQVVIYSGQLPDEVASHFGVNGQADGSMTRNAFMGLMVALQFGLALMICGLSFSMGKLPASLLNIPNKEYWLHEDRKTETIAYNQNVLNWIAAATAVFMVVLFQLTIQANMGNGVQKLNLPVFGISMVVYLAIVMGLSITMVLKFSNVPRR